MNVVIVKLSSIGDVVHALPVAATLRARLPGARITWLCERREAVVLVGHPAIDEIVVADTRGWRRARGLDAMRAVASGFVALARQLRSGRFDVALDLQGLLKSGLLTACTRAPLRIGFESSRCRERVNALFTNRRVLPPESARHVADQYLALLEPLGVAGPVREFRLPCDPAAEAAIDDVFSAAGLKPRNRVVVLNPGAARADKRWPVERFRSLGARLATEAGAQVIVVWGPGEASAARAIAGPAGGRVLLAPPTDIHQLIAVLRRASLLVAADTGPLHLAAAIGTPCVGLYGPTRAERNGPYGSGHRALEGREGRVGAIGVEDVLRAAVELLG
ncbi:MAG TPA: lipopolysaccharide heptosyltransferase I [Methylomirabilota bacterium]|nr:lipopolysaccharide heptosyltransferase I [Methylomirabilota bacterium]